MTSKNVTELFGDKDSSFEVFMAWITRLTENAKDEKIFVDSDEVGRFTRNTWPNAEPDMERFANKVMGDLFDVGQVNQAAVTLFAWYLLMMYVEGDPAVAGKNG